MKLDLRIILIVVGAMLFGGYKAATALFGPSWVLVFAGPEALEVDVVQGGKSVAHRVLTPGAHARLQVSSGDTTVTTSGGATPWTVELHLGANETWVAPTSGQQCFVLVDFAGQYGAGRARQPARLEKRFVEPKAFRLANHVHASVRELPGIKGKNDSAKVLDAAPCEQLKHAGDAELASLVEHAALSRDQVADQRDQAQLGALANDVGALKDELVHGGLRREFEQLGWKVNPVDKAWVLTADGREAHVYELRALDARFPGLPKTTELLTALPALARAVTAPEPTAAGAFSLAGLTATFEPIGEVQQYLGGGQVFFVLQRGDERLGLTPAILEAAKVSQADLASRVTAQAAGRVGPTLLSCLEKPGVPTPCGEASQAAELLVSLGAAMKPGTTLDVFLDAEHRLTLALPRGSTPPRSTMQLIGRIAKTGDAVTWR